ncbi:MAG: hypothetical protein M1834_007624 [Cirrosporium novae-zelandiae]|nr:MAG: hypothetical protein M1834_007624 [Cirrosporium novae-zelandiae]
MSALGGLRFIEEVNDKEEHHHTPRHRDSPVELPRSLKSALKRDQFSNLGTSSPGLTELEEYSWGETSHVNVNPYSIPGTPSGKWSPTGIQTPAGAITPKTPNELEMSLPPTPKESEAANIAHSIMKPYMNRFRYATACVTCFLNGMNDGAPGALIPYMEEYYHIGYAIVSLVFISNALGYIVAAPMVHALDSRFGRSKVLMTAECIRSLAYIAMVCTPSFPVIVVAFFFVGLAMATGLALNNVFCVNLVDSTTALAGYHGSYGIGATISPLIGTALVSHGILWSRFYFITIVLSIGNFFLAGWSFKNYAADLPTRLISALQQTVSRMSEENPSKMRILKNALKNRTTILGALFTFAYQGAEVAISGWVISYLITYRDGDPSKVGYVSAGFWAGITLGRFTLVHQAHRIGEKYFVSALTAGALIFQLLVWLIPNVIGEAVACALLGYLLGPIAPTSTAIFSKLLPRSIQMSSLSFVSAMGSSGGAIWPFMTGLIAQSAGTFVLHPICIGLYVVMLAFVALLPRVGKRVE